MATYLPCGGVRRRFGSQRKRLRESPIPLLFAVFVDFEGGAVADVVVGGGGGLEGRVARRKLGSSFPAFLCYKAAWGGRCPLW
ncbi:hypothetical protein TB2_025156 [Malus domestica]